MGELKGNDEKLIERAKFFIDSYRKPSISLVASDLLAELRK